jgi:putative FmdB family regulatory protein
MPLYEFECQDCRHQFEELMTASASELPPCPVCQGRQVRKKVSAGAIRSGGIKAGSAVASGPSCAPTGG